MRARLLFFIVAILLVGGFAAQNWPEFQRTAPLNFGVIAKDAPLGLIMLAVFGVTLLAFLLSAAMQESRHLMESSRHARTLQAQRDLAEKAEASRFTDLRQQLDAHLRENRQRDSIAATEFEKNMAQGQRELRNQLETMHRTLDGRFTDLETRIAARLDRLQPVAPVEVTEVTPREHVKV